MKNVYLVSGSENSIGQTVSDKQYQTIVYDSL